MSMIYRLKTACTGDDYFLGAHLYAQSYIIVGWCENYAAPNGLFVGTLLEDVDDSEVETTALTYADFEFCDTWAFQQCVNMQPSNVLQSAQAAIAAARKLMQAEMQQARTEMMEEAERIMKEKMELDDIHELPDSLIATAMKSIEIMDLMRKAQKAKQYNAKHFEETADLAIKSAKALFKMA